MWQWSEAKQQHLGLWLRKGRVCNLPLRLNMITHTAIIIGAANDLAADETQLQSLQAQESAIAQAKTTMNTVRNVTIPAMIDSLNAFNTIWDGIVSDCQTSIDYLNQTISNEETVSTAHTPAQ